jgi:hypothetical protein
MQLLAHRPSWAGYVTASTIMDLENVIEPTEDWQADWAENAAVTRAATLAMLPELLQPLPNDLFDQRTD